VLVNFRTAIGLRSAQSGRTSKDEFEVDDKCQYFYLHKGNSVGLIRRVNKTERRIFSMPLSAEAALISHCADFRPTRRRATRRRKRKV
jgi:hypothetical protein